MWRAVLGRNRCQRSLQDRTLTCLSGKKIWSGTIVNSQISLLTGLIPFISNSIYIFVYLLFCSLLCLSNRTIIRRIYPLFRQSEWTGQCRGGGLCETAVNRPSIQVPAWLSAGALQNGIAPPPCSGTTSSKSEKDLLLFLRSFSEMLLCSWQFRLYRRV